MPINPALRKLRQEDCEFEALLCYRATEAPPALHPFHRSIDMKMQASKQQVSNGFVLLVQGAFGRRVWGEFPGDSWYFIAGQLGAPTSAFLLGLFHLACLFSRKSCAPFKPTHIALILELAKALGTRGVSPKWLAMAVGTGPGTVVSRVIKETLERLRGSTKKSLEVTCHRSCMPYHESKMCLPSDSPTLRAYHRPAL